LRNTIIFSTLLFLNHAGCRAGFNTGRHLFWALGGQRGLLLALAVLAVGSGCSYKQKNILFKESRYQQYYRKLRTERQAVIRLKDANAYVAPYRFQVGDGIRVQYVNVCSPLLEELKNSAAGSAPPASGVANGSSGTGSSAPVVVQSSTAQGYTYQIDERGELTLPLIGRMTVRGMTVLSLRDTLEAFVREYCKGQSPTIELTPTSLRAYYFNEGGTRSVVSLRNEHTPIAEFLAQTGGIEWIGKANKIQIIRGDPNDPQVIWVDAQQFDALRDLNLFIQPNDIIYVEPRELPRIGRELAGLTVVFTVVNIVTTVILLSRL
jgi:polysaccharide export outer membrane protein